MSRFCEPGTVRCPICASWDTVYESQHTLQSVLLCRPCGGGVELRPVWCANFELKVEWVYYADGSIKQTTYEWDEAANERRSDQPAEHDEQDRPFHLDVADEWRFHKLVEVRMFSAEEMRDADIAYALENIRNKIYALRRTIPAHDPAWEPIAAALTEASGLAIPKLRMSAQRDERCEN